MDKKTAIMMAKTHIGQTLTDTNLIIQYMQLHKLASFYHAVQKLSQEAELLDKIQEEQK
jgi:hypothetical protein